MVYRIVSFYNSLFTELFNWGSKLDGLFFFFESIDEVEAIWLERAFEEEEVLEVVKAALMVSEWRFSKLVGM